MSKFQQVLSTINQRRHRDQVAKRWEREWQKCFKVRIAIRSGDTPRAIHSLIVRLWPGMWREKGYSEVNPPR